MIRDIREKFNEGFSEEKYAAFLESLLAFDTPPLFRIVETPVFVDELLKGRLIEATEQIVDLLVSPGFMEKSALGVPKDLSVPNETAHPDFLAIDFAVCVDEKGDYMPQLIELQGFPSLFCFLDVLAEKYKTIFEIEGNWTHYFPDINREEYYDFLREIIVGEHNAKNVILLEVEPEKQKTQIDFLFTEQKLGVKTVCLSKVKSEGKKLYYEVDGKQIPIHRIYNRLIFEDIHQHADFLKDAIDIREGFEVEWVSHPNWFFRISKHTLPALKTPYVPDTNFLDKDNVPEDLSQYVLKPLFSFSGQGVIMDVTQEAIDAVEDPSNYILQKKIEYVPVIDSPHGKIKCEIRMLYAWKKGEERPTLLTNLARMSQGMIGVSHNKASSWSGGTVAFFRGT